MESMELRTGAQGLAAEIRKKEGKERKEKERKGKKLRGEHLGRERARHSRGERVKGGYHGERPGGARTHGRERTTGRSAPLRGRFYWVDKRGSESHGACDDEVDEAEGVVLAGRAEEEEEEEEEEEKRSGGAGPGLDHDLEGELLSLDEDLVQGFDSIVLDVETRGKRDRALDVLQGLLAVLGARALGEALGLGEARLREGEQRNVLGARRRVGEGQVEVVHGLGHAAARELLVAG
eukprot:CAMPEP_0202075322 /NCGR_PEP_ID=MMETSP0964-20121228/4140_1 /ASSEMBLY_ACC=CAM_ASM_000500 /TAXON_ID=4773 /ORGANISM="Schizochytrium aggregatum, Strain ATCC28209" /LENGTH=235 /DNA_ID=CAMNT_0048642509 /DNA_START=140 /DNA_END=844 /DNA_ORIENTATION=-